MQIKSVSNQSSVGAVFEKQLTSLCNNMEQLIWGVSVVFLDSSIEFLSSDISVTQLNNALNALLPYEVKSSELHSFAEYIYSKFEGQIISMNPASGIIHVIYNLWERSAFIPGWLRNVDYISERLSDSSVESVKNTVNQTVSNVFKTFIAINKLLVPLKELSKDIYDLPLSIQECPKISEPDTANKS
jgi:hypothetical protein